MVGSSTIATASPGYQSVNNIYDMKNYTEWTTETTGDASYQYVSRGGKESYSTSMGAGAQRGLSKANTSNYYAYYSFRAALFL